MRVILIIYHSIIIIYWFVVLGELLAVLGHLKFESFCQMHTT